MDSDYYSTPDSYRRLWDHQWRNMFQHGTWASGQHCTPINKIFDCSFHPYACLVCKRGPFTDTKLVRCAQCRVVKYCCQDHQRADWPSHKTWCKAFVALKNANDGDFDKLQHPGDMQIWRMLSTRVGLKVNRIASVGLHTITSQLVASQPRCRKCLVAGISPDTELITCSKCHSVALCKNCHMEEDNGFHTADDSGHMECENHQISQACTGLVVEQGCPLFMESISDVEECFQPKDWVEYFDKKRGDFELPPMMLDMAPVVALLSDGLSLPLTILHVLGLPAFLGKKEVPKLDHLVVHLVGASAQEALGVSKFIELTRLMPELTRLRIVLVGPDLDDNEGTPLNISDPDAIKIRSSCNARISIKKGYYHDVADRLGEDPTLVVASHPGIFDGHYTEYWKPTVQLLASRNVPFVVTGYNKQEVLNDCKHLEEFGSKVVVEPSANPFRGLRPCPDPSRECSDFIFANSHFVATRGSK